MRDSQRYITFLIITLLCGLHAYGQENEEHLPYWVFFNDKEVTDQSGFNPTDHNFPHLSQRALDRRALRGTITGPTYQDLPVSRTYIDEILAT
ncbi:MAG: hypothetical protein K9M55_07570, partial [Candidatus Marinimicrobia bacterium]|nr:hypothetical protein [Candidatus Neomarinimicrobiota bacterium]